MSTSASRRRRRVGVIAAVAVPALIAGVSLTTASFTDTEKVSDNQITAGIFDILVTEKGTMLNGVAVPADQLQDAPASETDPGFAVSNQGNLNKRLKLNNFKPGDVAEFDLDVENVGTIMADWSMAGTATYVDGNCVDEGDGSESAACVGASMPLEVEITGGLATPVSPAVPLTSAALVAANTSLAADDGALDGADVQTLHFKITWPAGAANDGNNMEGASVDIDLVFDAVQSP